MKLVTWNVNSLKVRLPRVLELLAEYEPDIVCMQETKSEDAAFPTAELAAGERRGDEARWIEALAPGLERVGIERNYRKGSKPSDHAPLVAMPIAP